MGVKILNKLTLTRDISERCSLKPYLVNNTYEFPYDSDLEELFHIWKQILIALTYPEETIDQFFIELGEQLKRDKPKGKNG